jgi:DNA-binding SARP family transcriptional activator
MTDLWLPHPTQSPDQSPDRSPDQSPGLGDRLAVQVLGPLTVLVEGAVLEPGPAMVANLLGLLALHLGRPVTTEQIAGVLWGPRRPPSHHNLIQVYVSRLRARLAGAGAGVEHDGAGYRLAVPDGTVDLDRFERRYDAGVTAAGRGAAPEAVGHLEAALATWRGTVLGGAGVRFEQLAAVSRANRQRTAAALQLAGLHGALGRHDRAVDTLSAAAGDAPLHEGLHAALMRALARTGDRAGALALYRDLRRRLADDLGVEPGQALQSVHVELLRDGRRGPRDRRAAHCTSARTPG